MAENIKVTLLGNCGVGKTCIIQRYINNSYEENYNSTNGASYSQKLIKKNGKDYQLDIWDTAGQEKYRSLGKNFYRDAYIVILVYDITRKDSFQGIKEIWYPDLLKYGENDVVLAVVGNKCDKYEEDDIVNEDEARAFANEIKGKFMIVSAKNGINIQNLFDDLMNDYCDPEFHQKVEEVTRPRKSSTKIRKNTTSEEKKLKEKKSSCC